MGLGKPGISQATTPADRVTLPRIEKKELVPLQVSTGDGLEVIMKVIQFTGMRESEALGLTWDCADFKAGTVKVCKQLQKHKLADSAARMEAYIKSL